MHRRVMAARRGRVCTGAAGVNNRYQRIPMDSGSWRQRGLRKLVDTGGGRWRCDSLEQLETMSLVRI